MIETGGWGGIWHYACCLGNALRDEGLDLNMLTSCSFEQPFELRFKISPHLNHKRSYIANIVSLYMGIAALRPSVVHLQSWFSARRDWVHLLVCRAFRLPLVVTAHNFLPHDSEERRAPFMSWAFQKIYRSADAVIVHSRANRERIIEAFRIPEERVIFVKHGNYRFFTENFPVDSFEARREYLGGNVNRRTFLIFGAIRHYKGIDLALKAMSHLPRLSGMHLIVAGKPHPGVLNACKGLASDLKLLEHLTFLPKYFNIQEVAKIHSAADICVFPYRDVFQSGSLQTALAFGKPIIATSVGSFPETLNSTNAWLVEPDSPSSLAQAFEKAVSIPEQDLVSMGKESLRISTEEHDWKMIAQQTKTVYLSLR